MSIVPLTNRSTSAIRKHNKFMQLRCIFSFHGELFLEVKLIVSELSSVRQLRRVSLVIRVLQPDPTLPDG